MTTTDEPPTPPLAQKTPLVLTAKQSGLRIMLTPTDAATGKTVCKVFSPNHHSDLPDKQTELSVAVFFVTDKLALRINTCREITFYYYKTSYQSSPIFRLLYDSKKDAWLYETKDGKTRRLEKIDTLGIEDEPEQFLCEPEAQANAYHHPTSKPSSGTIKKIAVTDFELPTQKEFLAFQSEILTYLRSEKYVENAPTLWGGSQTEREKTLRIRTDGHSPIWFIGDIHGDLLALKIISDFTHRYDHAKNSPNALSKNEKTKLFFLGDFIDRGEFSADVLAWVMGAAAGETFEGKQFDIRAILGNHDAALFYNRHRRRFNSVVTPSEFFAQLNDNPDAEPFGKAVLAFFQKLPVLVMLDDVLMAVHGGVPHPAKFAKLKKRADLETVLDDFYWVRLHETLPRKHGSLTDVGGELGYEDFYDSLKKLGTENFFGVIPKIAIRGHDHELNNFQEYENYKKCKVLTVNAMTSRRTPYGMDPQRLAIIRWLPSDPLNPCVFTFEIPEFLLYETQCNLDIQSAIAPEVYNSPNELKENQNKPQ
jgi:hypothetical protein